MKNTLLLTIVLLSALMLLNGCSNEEFDIHLSAPKEFKVGESVPMKLTVTNGEKKLSDLLIQGHFDMVDMDHGTVSVDFNDIGDGQYIGYAALPMGGQWEGVFTLDNEKREFQTMENFSIVMDTGHETTKGAQLPDFQLVDQDGKSFTRKEVEGKKTVVTFTYTRCNLEYACPVQIANLRSLQKKLESEKVDTSKLQLISISVDPEFDTPEVLKQYANNLNIEQSYFKMLTGEQSEIKQIAEVLGIYFEKDGDIVNHDTNTLVFDESGKLTHEFETSAVDLDELFNIVTDAN
ncbi:SCO family protein [Bacillus tianshenii]|nr:SCO family protein [Bacillus tianshenii]